MIHNAAKFKINSNVSIQLDASHKMALSATKIQEPCATQQGD